MGWGEDVHHGCEVPAVSLVVSGTVMMHVAAVGAAQELYGRFDELSQLWTDGLAARILREAANAPDNTRVHKWTVFDGPIDSKWIENMNTVRIWHGSPWLLLAVQPPPPHKSAGSERSCALVCD